ncbi:MAG: NYN domain-containing protein [Clostridia bacterium]|nr:NYN domain-containing protein [Clostridia bacterium]
MKPLLLVDGYNVIGAWTVPQREHLTIEESRDRLIHMIADYAGYSGEEVIVVFDGHYTDRPMSTRIEQYGIQVVFTRHGESADNYIEASCEAAPKWRKVRVATSDAVEQTVTMGRGAVRISSREFLMELSQVRTQGKRTVATPPSRGDLLTRLTPQQREIFDRMRKGEAEE